MASSQDAICSYGPACYRRNLDHFLLMSHPHLDDLLESIPKNKPINLPEKLKFACTSRSLLKEQLEVLRTARETKCTVGETSRTNVRPKDDCKVIVPKVTRAEALSMMRACGEAPDYLPQPGKFAEKHKNAAPYYIFFTAVQKAKTTWSQESSVTMSELMDKSLGNITFSLHLSYVIDIGWLCSQYMLAEQKPDMVVFYGQQAEENCPVPANIKMHKISCPTTFGCHHSKLSIFQYQDSGIRVIVSSANLYKDDYHLRTQGLWMSPHLPRLPTSANAADGESKTGFKKQLLLYLSQYSSEMDQWKAIVKRTDFSSVNVAFVFSVPGTYRDDSKDRWGHGRLASILKEHVEIPRDEPRTTIVGQTSSMGNFGENYNNWVGSQILNSMIKTRSNDEEVDFKLIFPTIENYKSSYDMREGANCLCYTERGHNAQLWLANHFHRWVANRTGRSSAVPHIKTYTRMSSDESKIWWFVLGSHNFSKAAWGYKRGRNLCILNYETSIVFLPKFVTETTSFPIKSNVESTTPTFPIPYDLPLTRYNLTDKPFVTEFFQKGDKVFSQ